MSFWNENDYVNVPTSPMVDQSLYDFALSNYGVQLPTHTDQECGHFDPCLDVIPPCSAYTTEAYTSAGPYTLSPGMIAPAYTLPTAAAVVTQAGSPGSMYDLTDASSGEASSSGGSRLGTPRWASNRRNLEGRRGAHRHAPYTLGGRPSISPAQCITGDGASRSVFPSEAIHRSSFETAYKHSPIPKIQAELNRLSKKLGQLGLKRSRHHPYMTCPVFDCEKGGHNELLHGPCSSLPNRQSASNSLSKPPPMSPSAYSTAIAATETEPEMYQPSGPFFTFHEITRHVKSVHMPALDLRCDYPACAAQARLDFNAGGDGLGRFCRADVMRTHLKKFKTHRQYISDELRYKYKLWRD